MKTILITLLIVVAVCVWCLFWAYFLSAMIHAATYNHRQEKNKFLKLFCADDFDGLKAEPVEFKNTHGDTLRGNFYFEDKRKDFLAVMIFSHGMGGGHLSYTTEIDYFAKKGFLVLGFDNTGTIMSDGKKIGGMEEGVLCVKSAVEFVKKNERTKDMKIVLCGHSLGAYSVLRSLSFVEKDVCAVVAFSAPNRFSRVVSDMARDMHFKIRILEPFLTRIEAFKFGDIATKSTAEILSHTKVPVLCLQGDSDATVKKENSPVLDPLLENQKNVQCVMLNGRGHNVYLKKDSERYLNQSLAKINQMQKEKKSDEEILAFSDTLDFKFMTQEDPEVMEKCFEFLFLLRWLL